MACDVEEAVFVDEADDLLCQSFFDIGVVDVGNVQSFELHVRHWYGLSAGRLFLWDARSTCSLVQDQVGTGTRLGRLIVPVTCLPLFLLLLIAIANPFRLVCTLYRTMPLSGRHETRGVLAGPRRPHAANSDGATYTFDQLIARNHLGAGASYMIHNACL